MGNSWAAWIGLPVAAAVIGAALALSVGASDFCHIGPTSVMVAMSNKNQYIAYYLQCAGVNPMQPSYDSFKKTYDEMVDLVVSVVEGAGSSGACTGPPAAFEAIVVALAELKVIIDEGGYLLSCDMVQPLVQNLAYDKFCDQMVDTIFLVWLVLAVGGFLTILAL